MQNPAMELFQQSGGRYVRYCISLTSNLSERLQPILKDLDQSIGKVRMPSSPQFKSVHETTDWLDIELKNIISALEWCVANKRHEPLISLIDNFVFYLWSSCHWDELEFWLSQGLEAASIINDVLYKASYLEVRGRLHESKGDLEQARTCFAEALSIYKDQHDLTGEAWMHYHLGEVYAGQGLWSKAIEFYQFAQITFDEQGNLEGLSNVYVGLGNLYRYIGEWNQAEKLLKEAMALYETSGDIDGLSTAYNGFGRPIRFTRQMEGCYQLIYS